MPKVTEKRVWAWESWLYTLCLLPSGPKVELGSLPAEPLYVFEHILLVRIGWGGPESLMV